MATKKELFNSIYNYEDKIFAKIRTLHLQNHLTDEEFDRTKHYLAEFESNLVKSLGLNYYDVKSAKKNVSKLDKKLAYA